MLAILAKLGFVTRELLLTPLQFGVPNSRLRYYLLAARRPSDAFLSSVDSGGILRHIPGHGTEWSDARLASSSSAAGSETVEGNVRPLRDYLDRTDNQAYPVPEHVLIKWGRLFDIVLPSAMRTCCFTRGQFGLLTLTHLFDRPKGIRDLWNGRVLFYRRARNLTSVCCRVSLCSLSNL